MSFYQIGDRILNLDTVCYAQKIEHDRIWLIFEGGPVSIEGIDAPLVWGILESRILRTIAEPTSWAIASALGELLSVDEIFVTGCDRPKLFASRALAALWIENAGIEKPIEIVPYDEKTQKTLTFSG